MAAATQAVVAKYSREWFLERLGPEMFADGLAQVAAAPAPSPEKVAEIRRLFAPAVAKFSQ